MNTSLVLVAAFLLAQERKRGSLPWTHLSHLKAVALEIFDLVWQWGVLALLETGLQRTGFGWQVYADKALLMAAAYGLSTFRKKPPVYFLVLTALALAFSDLKLFLLAMAAILGLEILWLGGQERFFLARIPERVQGLPLALLSFFLIAFALWAAGFSL